MSASSANQQPQKLSQHRKPAQQRFNFFKNSWARVNAYLVKTERLSRDAGAVATGRGPIALVINEVANSSDTNALQKDKPFEF